MRFPTLLSTSTHTNYAHRFQRKRVHLKTPSRIETCENAFEIVSVWTTEPFKNVNLIHITGDSAKDAYGVLLCIYVSERFGVNKENVAKDGHVDVNLPMHFRFVNASFRK